MAMDGVTHTFVVANEHYEDTDHFGQVKYAHRDAEDFFNLVTSEAFEPVDRRFAVLHKNLGHDAFNYEFLRFFEGVQKGDHVIIFYAGHGLTEEREGYLVPVDYDVHGPVDPDHRALPFSRLRKWIRQKEPASVICLFDSCHSGAALDALARKGQGNEREFINASLKRTFDSDELCTGVMAACCRNQIARGEDSLGHGLFTHYLLEALRGGVDSGGATRVDMETVFRYVYTCVTDYARENRLFQSPVRLIRGGEPLMLPNAPTPPRAESADEPAGNEPSRAEGDASCGKTDHTDAGPSHGAEGSLDDLERLIATIGTTAAADLAALFKALGATNPRT